MSTSTCTYLTLQIVLNLFENKQRLISGIGWNFASNYCYLGTCICLYPGPKCLWVYAGSGKYDLVLTSIQTSSGETHQSLSYGTIRTVATRVYHMVWSAQRPPEFIIWYDPHSGHQSLSYGTIRTVATRVYHMVWSAQRPPEFIIWYDPHSATRVYRMVRSAQQ